MRFENPPAVPEKERRWWKEAKAVMKTQFHGSAGKGAKPVDSAIYPLRGGARKGAGRKPRPVPLDAITVKVEPEIALKFRTICEAKGKSQAAQFSEWVKRAKF